ncbi:hypothetical protein D3C87_1346950 [compost metagenome]
MVSTPMMPTMTDAGTPNSASARRSVSRFSCQKRTPALMRIGSMKRERYVRQLFRPGVLGGMISRDTVAEYTAWLKYVSSSARGKPWRATMSSMNARVCG